MSGLLNLEPTWCHIVFAGAEASFILAKNEVVTAKLTYEKIIGKINDINNLDKESDINFEIPNNFLNVKESLEDQN